MWANICCNKYSHSRVTSFRKHLKHNNDFTKLIYKEEHMPRHMRLNFVQRLLRFLFWPICAMASVALLRHDPLYEQIEDFCQRRIECFAACTNSNFPFLNCEDRDVEIEYNGNTYTDFFFYPKPTEEKSAAELEHYYKCAGYIDDNEGIQYTEQGEYRQLKIHTCFPQCRTNADCYLGFNVDKREKCTIGGSTADGAPEGILCASDETVCETLVTKNEMCLSEDNTLCIDWSNVWVAIIVLNSLQLVFEASMAYALEISLRPTSLDRLEDDLEDVDEQANPDKPKELDCTLVLNKCWGELAFILLYIFVLAYCCMGIIYQAMMGKPYSLLVEWALVLVFDQIKSVPCQLFIYWVVIRRLGSLPISEGFNGKWDDQYIHDGGAETSLMKYLRTKVQKFVEIKAVENSILGMTIVLCVVIFAELALEEQISDNKSLEEVFYMLNFFMLTFFIIEIVLKLFAYGFAFLKEFINTFDSIIVITSYVFLLLNLRLPILGLLRTLRLLKVIASMKKIQDAKRERQELIKKQKKESESMPCYIERVLDFLEKQAVNSSIPKQLQEDLQWAYELISQNKLYSANIEGFKLQEDRAEVKAWTNLISLKQIPENKKEVERLAAFAAQDQEAMKKKKTRQPNAFLNKDKNGLRLGLKKQNTMSNKDAMQGGMAQQQKVYAEIEPFEQEFLNMVELTDFQGELYETATQDLETIQFDVITFESMLNENALQFLAFKLFKKQNFFDQYHISLENLINLSGELQMGYFKENPYHCVLHILDSLQGLNYLLSNGEVVKSLKKHDIFGAFIACLLHDYEHPGYSNQFIVRAKHPLAIRYSDISVLENHHLAAGFAILYTYPKCNIMENMGYDLQLETRQLIINTVLNSDISKHFTLLTELKTKLGNNFPTDSIEDRTLILSVTLRIASTFKMVRERNIFYKWMDRFFDEFFKQGDMEKQLELQISKFMDRENTNRERAYSSYLTVVCRPLLVTYLILVDDQEVSNALLRDGIDKNKKSLETRIDESSAK